jgi:S-adenosylmethionine/arginine decarboxylase-like enzyme
MSEKFVPYHQHLLVKALVKTPPKEVEVLNKWFIELVHKVGMVVVAGPTSVYVNEPGNEGLTGTVTLATSHASIHIWDNLELPMLQFDIYSCKCFELSDVLSMFDEWELKEVEWMMINRNETPKVTSHGTLSYK